MILTAVIEAVQLEQVTVTELHTLANDITESGDPGDDGGLRAIAEGVFTVVHHGTVVVGYAQRAGGGVVVGVEVVFFTCGSDQIRKQGSVLFSSSSQCLITFCNCRGECQICLGSLIKVDYQHLTVV